MRAPQKRPSFLSGLPLVLGLLLLTRCSTSNGLSGSVSEIFPLDFNSVVLWRNSEAFQVTYYFAQFGNEDLVVQLTVELSGLDFEPGKTVDLSGTLPDGTPRTVVVHQAHAQPTLVLPQVQSGSLTLNSGGQTAGQETSGSFTLSFVNDGTVGALRTLSGSFDGLLTSATFPPDASFPTDGGDGGDAGGTTGGSTSGTTGGGASSGGVTTTTTTTTSASTTSAASSTSAASTTAGSTSAASTTAGSTSASSTTAGSTSAASTTAGSTSAASTTAASSSAGATSSGAATGTSSGGTSSGATTGTSSGGTSSGAASTGGSTGTSSGGTSSGGTTGSTCTTTTCPAPGVCSNQAMVCCTSGPGTTADAGPCATDCDCVDLSCTALICD